MNLETATVKPEANFPRRASVLRRTAIWRGQGPSTYRALETFGSAVGRARAGHDCRGLCRLRRARDGRASANLIELAGRWQTSSSIRY